MLDQPRPSPSRDRGAVERERPLFQRGPAVAAGHRHRADRRLRLFHGGTGLDDDRRVDPGDGEEPRAEPAAAQSGDHDVFAEPRRVHSGQRLDRRPAGDAHRVLFGDRDFHGRIGAMRAGDKPADAVGDAGDPGFRRGDDDAGRPADSAAQLSAERTCLGDELDDHSGDDRSYGRPGRRRVHDQLDFLARDFLFEFADRRARLGLSAPPVREFSRAGADAFRLARDSCFAGSGWHCCS